MKRRNVFFTVALAGLMIIARTPGWTAQAAEQILVEEISEVPSPDSDPVRPGSSRTEAVKKAEKFQIGETMLPRLFLTGQARRAKQAQDILERGEALLAGAPGESEAETAGSETDSEAATDDLETQSEAETNSSETDSEAVTDDLETYSEAEMAGSETDSEAVTGDLETQSEAEMTGYETDSGFVTDDSETQSEAETNSSETDSEFVTDDSETQSEAETTGYETDSEFVTDDSETQSGAETTPAKFSQGLYEIISATNIYYLLDVKHCTVNETDSKTVQTFRSLDVNQQKFYIEKLPDNFWRISVVNSGEALTASDDDASFCLAAMEHPEDAAAADSQSWALQDAGDGFFYIQSRGGNYVTLEAWEAYSGAAVVLQKFTGESNQKWLLGSTWISGNDVADTDLVNPYGEDGPCKNLSITLKFGQDRETLTSDELAAHMSENESHQYVLDQEFLTSYVDQLAARYDTQGQPRRFVTSNDKEITLTEGDFGWKLDTEGTRALIYDNLLSDSKITLEPVWAHKGVSFTAQSDRINDIGNSYIEVDLTSQKVWLYKNGRCLLESDCVSGTMGTEAQTPSGVYSIYYMQSPAVLNGPGYSSPVTYWMPFFGGFGLHDATWRTEFGGEIFRSDGSHGCVNLPLENAEIIYNAVELGYPVVLYY